MNKQPTKQQESVKERKRKKKSIVSILLIIPRHSDLLDKVVSCKISLFLFFFFNILTHFACKIYSKASINIYFAILRVLYMCVCVFTQTFNVHLEFIV